MNFSNTEQIKQYVLQRLQPSIAEMQEEVYRTLDEALKEYYAEYDPQVYERTNQLLHSLVKSEIIETANGYKAFVYFDYTALDYHQKSFYAFVNTKGQYYNPFNMKTQSNPWFDNPKGDGKKTMGSAAVGKHGGKASGTSIYYEPIGILKAEFHSKLKQILISNGIPIR